MRNFIYDKVRYDHVVGYIGNLGKTTLIKAVILSNHDHCLHMGPDYITALERQRSVLM